MTKKKCGAVFVGQWVGDGGAKVGREDRAFRTP